MESLANKLQLITNESKACKSLMHDHEPNLHSLMQQHALLTPFMTSEVIEKVELGFKEMFPDESIVSFFSPDLEVRKNAVKRFWDGYFDQTVAGFLPFDEAIFKTGKAQSMWKSSQISEQPILLELLDKIQKHNWEGIRYELNKEPNRHGSKPNEVLRLSYRDIIFEKSGNTYRSNSEPPAHQLHNHYLSLNCFLNRMQLDRYVLPWFGALTPEFFAEFSVSSRFIPLGVLNHRFPNEYLLFWPENKATVIADGSYYHGMPFTGHDIFHENVKFETFHNRSEPPTQRELDFAQGLVNKVLYNLEINPYVRSEFARIVFLTSHEHTSLDWEIYRASRSDSDDDSIFVWSKKSAKLVLTLPNWSKTLKETLVNLETPDWLGYAMNPDVSKVNQDIETGLKLFKNLLEMIASQ